ncbi:histidine--tRNA ligase, partial [candidate division WOR-3 bacterium]|nr:histidine--tRNA ligase [candidate division WOR-3 bacterium]
MGSDVEFSNVKGTRDILPEDALVWRRIEEVIRKKMREYNYQELQIPTFEYTELFRKSTGKDTDVVQKEMYTFKDKGGRSLTLKPEGTPSVVRLYLQHGMKSRGVFQKFYYIERMFRQEKPQKGRLREFRSFGAEAIGSKSALTDAELIKSALDIMDELGIKGIEVRINSIGCQKCRKEFMKEFKKFLQQKLGSLCEDCQRRFTTNPMRIMDCKVDKRKLIDAPVPLDYLCDDCRRHFSELEKHLDYLEIDYRVDTFLARGLDYYTRTVFEFIHSELGARDAVGGGGRYDGLIKFLGGKDAPASGYAMGMDRMLLLMPKVKEYREIDIYIVTLDVKSDIIGWELLYKLRENGFSADKDCLGRSPKA